MITEQKNSLSRKYFDCNNLYVYKQAVTPLHKIKKPHSGGIVVSDIGLKQPISSCKCSVSGFR